MILSAHRTIFPPWSEWAALSGPNMGCVARMDTCSGSRSFISLTGYSLTEHTSITNASGASKGATVSRVSRKTDMGTERITIF